MSAWLPLAILLLVFGMMPFGIAIAAEGSGHTKIAMRWGFVGLVMWIVGFGLGISPFLTGEYR